MKNTTLDIDTLSTVLKLAGDKTRLTMIACLAEKEYCVCNFVDMFDMSQPAISQHLRKLKNMGIVKETRNAQWIYYSLNLESEYYPVIQDIVKYVSIDEARCSCDGECSCKNQQKNGASH